MVKTIQSVSRIAALFTLLILVGSQSVFAFTDIQGDPAEAKIEALRQQGIISGINEESFAPSGQITFAQGVQLLVQGFGLNIDNLRFFQAPKASHYFSHAQDDAWYAQSLIIAYHNGITLNRDMQPNTAMTREQFALALHQAIQKHGNYAVNQMWIAIADEAAFSSDPSLNAVQDLLKMNIVRLDTSGSFVPQTSITRSAAAEWLFDALEFISAIGSIPEPQSSGDADTGQEQVHLSTAPVSDAVNKVTLSRGIKPNAGYSIQITGIDFVGDSEAVIRYKLGEPEPGRMYAAVVTEPKAEVYLAASLRITIKQE